MNYPKVIYLVLNLKYWKDQRRVAFAHVWNLVIRSFHERDLLSTSECSRFSFDVKENSNILDSKITRIPDLNR